jgi:hypothetical protein
MRAHPSKFGQGTWIRSAVLGSADLGKSVAHPKPNMAINRNPAFGSFASFVQICRFMASVKLTAGRVRLS